MKDLKYQHKAVDELVTEIVETEQADIQEQGTLDFGDNADEKGGEE